MNGPLENCYILVEQKERATQASCLLSEGVQPEKLWVPSGSETAI